MIKITLEAHDWYKVTLEIADDNENEVLSDVHYTAIEHVMKLVDPYKVELDAHPPEIHAPE